MSSEFVGINDVRLHYDLRGDESAPVVVLSNSLGTNMSMWEPQLDALLSKYRVLRYDTRGHGLSSVPQGSYTVDQLGNDVISLLNYLEIDKVSFCGLSMGGQVGMWLAINHGNRIDKLILANTAAYIGPASNWNSRIETVEADGIEPIAESVVSRWLTPDYSKDNLNDKAYLKRMLATTPVQGYIANCQAVRDTDLRSRLSHIKNETLIIAGNGDLATPPADSDFLNAEISGSRVVRLDAAHISNWEQKELFTRSIVEFLE